MLYEHRICVDFHARKNFGRGNDLGKIWRVWRVFWYFWGRFFECEWKLRFELVRNFWKYVNALSEFCFPFPNFFYRFLCSTGPTAYGEIKSRNKFTRKFPEKKIVLSMLNPVAWSVQQIAFLCAPMFRLYLWLMSSYLSRSFFSFWLKLSEKKCKHNREKCYLWRLIHLSSWWCFHFRPLS